PNKDNKLGANDVLGLVGEQITYFWNLIEQRNSTAIELVFLLDQARQQHRLTIGDRHRTLDFALRNSRRQRTSGRVRGLTDFLLDIQTHIAVGAYARDDAKNNARATVIDRIDDRVVCTRR